jgi:hypothetical protein
VGINKILIYIFIYLFMCVCDRKKEGMKVLHFLKLNFVKPR